MVPLPSLDAVVERVLANLKAGYDSAMVAAPGSGTSTLAGRLNQELTNQGTLSHYLNMKPGPTFYDSVQEVKELKKDSASEKPKVLIIDHAAKLAAEDFGHVAQLIQDTAASLRARCLWVGSLDARAILEKSGIRIHTVPKSHVSFPALSRDDMLKAYRQISQEQQCYWGEAVLFLLLDFCGNDLSLAHSATEYFHGDWTQKLYDLTVWDRLVEWLSTHEAVGTYRIRLKDLSTSCFKYLALFRLGGKPLCRRAELNEETDDNLRSLFLQGFLAHNLLPGYYQVRNLTVHFLVNEPFKNWEGCRPEILFRRVTHQRASELIQEIEMMLRSILFYVFQSLEPEEVRSILERKQGQDQFMTSELNRALLKWATESGGQELKQGLNRLLLEHRTLFKESNSLWARAERMMERDGVLTDGQPVPRHLLCIDYLTFTETGILVLDLVEKVFPSTIDGFDNKTSLKARWHENIAKVVRLRNRTAHLRNVEFQDMEDLVSVVGSMRKDLIDFGVWGQHP